MRAVNVSHKETYEPVCFPDSRLSDIERGPHDGDTWPRQPAKPVSVASLSSSLFHIGKLKMKTIVFRYSICYAVVAITIES